MTYPVSCLFFIFICKDFVDWCFLWQTNFISPHEITHSSFWLQHFGKNTSECCNEIQVFPYLLNGCISKSGHTAWNRVTWNSLNFPLLLCFDCSQICIEKYGIHFISVQFLCSVYKMYGSFHTNNLITI